MGAFAEAATAYRAHGAVPIPCGGEDGKDPLVKWKALAKPPAQFTLDRWCERFDAANIGLVTGPSRLTIVDVDDYGGSGLADEMERRCGRTPLVTATPRGGLHLWYRGGGEKSQTRLEGMLVEVRAIGGFAVVPPSTRPGVGPYRIVRGSLDDLDRLPTIIANSLPRHRAQPSAGKPAAGAVVGEGRRNDTLWRKLMHEARTCETSAELEARALILNEAICSPPLDHAEVLGAVRSAWRYQIEGRNWVGEEPRVSVKPSEIPLLHGNADAVMVLCLLRSYQGQRDKFAISVKALARSEWLPRWSPNRIRKARAALIEAGFLTLHHEGGSRPGDASLYGWSMGHESCPNRHTSPPPAGPGSGPTDDESMGHESCPIAELDCGSRFRGRDPKG